MMTTVRKTHFSCALIWRQTETGNYEFLVQKVVSTKPGRVGKPQIKFPGGIGRLNCTPEETPELTARREILEETYLDVDSTSLDKVWEMKATPDPDKPDEEHMKYAFMTPFDQCRGTIRTEVLRDNNDTMEPPTWISVEELKYSLFRGHQTALLEACRRLGLM